MAPAGPLADWLGAAVTGAGGELTDDPRSATALVWCTPDHRQLPALLAECPEVTWVQLPFAGIERFLPLMSDGRTWTCAKDVYGPAVAEFALGLLIASFRGIDRYAQARAWQPVAEQTLLGSSICILGAGGIGRSLAAMLQPLGANVTVVSRSGTAIEGAEALRIGELRSALGRFDAVVVALPLTSETEGLVDRSFLESMKPTACLVNVARGRVVVTDDLVEALGSGRIRSAALDVTDPEPLPEGHPLWSLGNAMITPHVANTPALSAPVLVRLIAENTRRRLAGQPLAGLVDPSLEY